MVVFVFMRNWAGVAISDYPTVPRKMGFFFGDIYKLLKRPLGLVIFFFLSKVSPLHNVDQIVRFMYFHLLFFNFRQAWTS